MDLEKRSLADESYFLTFEEEKEIQNNFLEQLLLELKKVEYFFSENLRYYKARLEKIKDQLDYIKKNKVFKAFKENLEIALKEMNKELTVMKGFIELNLKAKIKILKKYKKFTKFCYNKLDVQDQAEKFIENSKLKEPLKLLSEVQADIEKNFYVNFFDKYSFNALKKLKDYAQPVYFTQQQSFYFGFFVGLLMILIILCLLIAGHFKIDMDDDAEFKTIFPIFRGFSIICFYFWLLGINVYAWNKAHINYRLCFSFKNHYSDVISIFKRAALFSTVFVLMILCYMIVRTQIPIIIDLVGFMPLEVIPLICWIVLLFYLFFPYKVFNYQGRLYLFNLFVESCATIFIKSEFKHIWFTDQLTSMIGPLRDIEYTTCYYFHYFSKY